MIYILLVPYTSDGETEIRILSGRPRAKGYWWQEVHYCQEIEQKEVGQLLLEAATDPALFLVKLRKCEGLEKCKGVAFAIPVLSKAEGDGKTMD